MTNEEINIAIHEKFFPQTSNSDFFSMAGIPIPDYCGNIGDAWKILEALAVSGYYFLLSVDLNGKTLAGIYKNKKCISQELEQKPAKAICLAALQIEVENE